jgi:hypothetical protein
MNFSMIMASRRGSCENQASLAIFAMRALGIPVTLEYTPKWFKDSRGHSWNAVCDSTGKHISFMGAETAPGAWHSGAGKNTTKIYRLTFAKQDNFRTTADTMAWEMQHNHIRDVSAEYEGYVTVNVPACFPDVHPENTYLAAMGKMEWNTVGICDTSVSVHKNVLYLPVYYMDGKRRSAGYPFSVDGNGHTVTFRADLPDSLLVFYGINQNNDHPYLFRMVGGVFEGANRPDFSDAKVIHTVKKEPDMYNSVKLSGQHSYRYVRYKSPKEGYCNVAEIEFTGTSGEKLEGRHIGDTGSFANLGQTGDKAFDGDIITFYDAAERSGTWTGLDLGEQQRITAIRYMPRVEGNGIYVGHEYELFCWDRDWKSLGRQTAVSTTVEFQASPSALFYIVNVTTQKKSKVFYISDKQNVFLE